MDADSLYELLIRLRDDQPGVPLVINGNGAACNDDASPADEVKDRGRMAYLCAHLAAVTASLRTAST
ncbi:family 1 glycosylhydrolase [Streptomyces sp. NPDC056656]|uniref:family 1 glycosylhydrolase n=1 Tax=Streptomyces sp. NPDC056656 TaxID=3345895 RepID=UPI0036CE69CB